MKYFVVSDIHSHYDALIKALNENYYDAFNKDHHLLVLGDLFDRGVQPKQTLRYLYDLHVESKATIILGNHDLFLLEFLEGDDVKAKFNIKHNGFGYTLEGLSNLTLSTSNLGLIRDKILQDYPFLISWIKSFPLFLEFDDYIFVHGGIDGRNKDWREGQSVHDFVWLHEHLQEDVEDKIVVAGHARTATIRFENADYKQLAKEDRSVFDIYYQDRKILIDSFVEYSGVINVLVLEF
jgi:serine/threonine protein phosphatase 1